MQLELLFPISPQPNWQHTDKPCPLLAAPRPGERVTVTLPSGDVEGAIAINKQGYLVARYPQGETIITSGFLQHLKDTKLQP